MLQIKKHKHIHCEEVFSLIKEVYRLENYSFSREDFIKYNDQRTLFTLHDEGDLLGTISLIECKGKDTLPLSALYASELGELLKEYPKIYEVGNFVIDKKKTGGRLSRTSLLGTKLLFKAIREEAKILGVDALVVAINPKHLSFYKLIGFEEFGEQKFYPFVSAPAIPLKLILKNYDEAEGFFARM